MGQQQVQQPGQSQGQQQKRKGFSRRQRIIATIIIAFIVALSIAIAQILSSAGIIPGLLATISNAIVGVLGVLFTFFALIPLLFPSDNPQPMPTSIAPQVSTNPVSTSQTTPVPDKPITVSIIGTFPPTDPKSIQQRHKIVEQVYSELTKPGINCIVLTGIGGVGKSTVAALTYRYTEEQRKQNTTPFAAESLWFTAEAATTFPDLAGILSTALDKPLANFGQLSPSQQTAAFFHILNATDFPRLVVVNQFENLLDAQTGQATDPALGEWIDVLNSQSCNCRILLTSRPIPRGTHDYPLTHMQEYRIEGLETNEGVELLRKQGVQTTQATDAELRTAVGRCAGHALSLELLASILRRNRSLSLHSLFNNPTYAQLWTGNIAHNLLDYIYEQQLNDQQRKLLVAFSVYRDPVPLEAAQAVVDADATTKTPGSLLDALNVLLAQHLLQESGNECYQLHIIVANYAKDHFDAGSEEANRQALRGAHAKAAQYYVQYAETNCLPRDKRRHSGDVKPLIEAVWQYCQAGHWQEAYDLILREGLFDDLKRWGGNVILLELYHLLSSSNWWQSKRLQEANIYYSLGQIYDNLGKKQEAYSCYKRALPIFQEEKDRTKEGAILNNLGFVCIDLEKPEEALYHLKQALYIRREVNDRSGESEALNDLGLAYKALGQMWQALDYLEQALLIRTETKDRAGEGETLNNLGFVYVTLGQQQKALDYFQQALHICKEVGNRSGEGNVLNNLGTSYQALGHVTEALASYEQALLIRKEVGDRDGEGVTLFNIGTLYLEQGIYITSFAAVFLAMSIFKEIQSLKYDGAQRWIDNICREIGEELCATLFAWVEPRAQQIVEQALREGL